MPIREIQQWESLQSRKEGKRALTKGPGSQDKRELGVWGPDGRKDAERCWAEKQGQTEGSLRMAVSRHHRHPYEVRGDVEASKTDSHAPQKVECDGINENTRSLNKSQSRKKK